jgi:protein-tyrosine phosphatase
MLKIGDHELDIDRVGPKLHQGGAVEPACDYEPFSMIVLCAQELQPELPRFRGRVVRAAFGDTIWPSVPELARAALAADLVHRELVAGGRVLVTCAAGLNRSGLVVGLVLTRTMPPEHAIALIRRARGEAALCNPTFHRIVWNAPMRPAPAPTRPPQARRGRYGRGEASR